MKNYSKLSIYFKENLLIVIPMCITALLFDGLMCFLPMIEGNTIDALNTGNQDYIIKNCIMFILLVLFVQINRFCKRYLVRVFGNKMTLKMRQVALNNLFKQDLNYFIVNNTGDILNRNLSDIADTTEGIRKMTTEVFDTFVLLIGYTGMMIYLDYKLTLIGIPFIALSILASHFMKKIVYKKNKEYKEYLSINKQLTLNRLNNEMNYRSLGVFDRYYESYEESIEILKSKTTKALLFQGSLEPLYLSIALAGLAVVALFGGFNVINDTEGLYTIGMLSSFITTYTLVAKKAGKVGKLFNAYQAFKVSWVRCKPYLAPIDEKNNDFTIENIFLDVKNFTLGYDSFSLPSISFKAAKGEIIGVCGKVHTGKTTLLRGLCGLYDYDGSATLGGYEINEFKDNKFNYINYCAANVALFSDTVLNNISLNREGNLEQALNSSALGNDINQIGGLDAILSHSNANISGGQQKRLQMARALYTSSALILLDDPFQSVNKDLAFKMMQELKAYKNSIIILVSNNKDILKLTNKIIYLDDEPKVDSYDKLCSYKCFKELMEA